MTPPPVAELAGMLRREGAAELLLHVRDDDVGALAYQRAADLGFGRIVGSDA